MNDTDMETRLEAWKAKDKAMQRNAVAMHNLLEEFCELNDRLRATETLPMIPDMVVFRQNVQNLLNKIEKQGEM